MDDELYYLLKNALSDIENLNDYYSAQSKNVHDYIIEKIEKYKYGVVLDRFFFSKIYEIDSKEISDDEQEIVKDIIVEYNIEENEEHDGISIYYKLNPNKDFSNYEMNPHLAREKFLNLIQHPNILGESLLIMLLIKFEDAISGLYRYLLKTYPQAYLSSKSITYSELVSLESNIDDIKNRFIDKEVEDFMRSPLSDWYKSFESKQKACFCFDNNEFEVFKEIYYRRNIIVHNQGIVNEVYLNSICESDKKIGERLFVDKEYLINAFYATKKVLIGTFYGLKKTSENYESLYKYLNDYGYNCLVNKEWDLAEYIFKLLLQDDKQQKADIICEKINLWISVKNSKGLDVIKQDIEKLDISALNSQFIVAKYALLDDYDNVSNTLEDEINKSIPVYCVKEWPLFNQYRESAQFHEFVKSHKELFETNEYESTNESVASAKDLIDEMGNDIDLEI